NNTVISNGSIIPEPDACTTRPSNRTGYTGAVAATAVPIPNNPIEVRNSPRVEKRSIRNAETGIITPLAIKNAVVIHWTWTVVMSKACWIDGSAVEIGRAHV